MAHDCNRYRGVNKPKAPCMDCWRFWVVKHCDAKLDASDVLRIADAVLGEVKGMLDTHILHKHSDLDDWI